MPSEKKVFGVLLNGDYDLFKIALKKYDTGESELVREIIHAWLFANKLQLKK